MFRNSISFYHLAKGPGECQKECGMSHVIADLSFIVINNIQVVLFVGYM